MSAPAIDLPLAEIAELCRQFHVTELSHYGSVLRDDFRPESDLDFLVTFEDRAPIGVFKFVDLQLALAELLGREVHLVSKNGLKPIIRDDVTASSRVIYPAG